MIPLSLGFGGPTDLMIIAGVVILLFGSSKFVDLGKSLGMGIKEFKGAIREEDPKTIDPPTTIVKQDDSSVAHP